MRRSREDRMSQKEYEAFVRKYHEDEDFSDIINIEHWDPKNHPRMLRGHRAKQFKPFLVTSQKARILERKKKRLEATGDEYEVGYRFDEQNDPY